jgi:hypothetical protein
MGLKTQIYIFKRRRRHGRWRQYRHIGRPKSAAEYRWRFRSIIKAIPHNSARADPEKIWVLIKALFRRCTLCTSRKSDEIRAQIFQEMPQAYCAVLPKGNTAQYDCDIA